MYKEILFVCMVILKGVSTQNATVDRCDTKVFLPEAQQKCLDLYGIPMTLSDPRSSSFALFTIMFPTDSNTTNAICRPELRDNYTKAALCVYSMISDCVNGNQLLQVFVPAPENVKLLVKQKCEGSGDYNQTCAVDHLIKLQGCVNPLKKSVSEVVFGQCMFVQNLRECTRQEFQPCGAATVQMHVENVRVPDTCKNDTDNVQNATKSVCHSYKGFLSECQKCMDKYEVPINISILVQRRQSTQSAPSLMKLLYYKDKNTTDLVCRPENRENYLKAATCLYSNMKKCAAEGTGENLANYIVIPTADNVKRLAKQECEGIGEYNQSCAMDRATDILDCVRSIKAERGDNSTDVDPTQSCSSVQITRQCARQEIQPCGVTTVQMNVRNLPYPDTCKNTTVTKCSDIKTFVSESKKCLDIHDVPINIPIMEVLAKSLKGVFTLMSQIDGNNTDIICRPENRENYIRAATCFYSLMRTCGAGPFPIFQIFIPNPKNLRRLITEECDDVREFDQRCAVGKIDEIVDCVNVTYRGDNTTSRYREDNSTEDGNLSCLNFQLTRECTRLKLQSCGVATVKMYEENLPVSDSCKKDTDLSLDCISRATDSVCDDKEPRVTSRRNVDQICGDAKIHNKCLKDAVLKRCGDVTASEYGEDLASKLPEMCRDSDTTATDNSAQTSLVSVYAMLLSAMLLY